MRIDQETIEQLDAAVISGMEVRLAGQMARPLYVKVDKVLKAAGGKWNRKAGAHIFDEEPSDILEQAMLTGSIRETKQELGIFYTPKGIAIKAAHALEISPGMSVLEPSAGMGALAKAARMAGGKVYCFDILQKHVDNLQKIDNFDTILADFLDTKPGYPFNLFDRVLMNPPFAKQADARHFMHALLWLKPGGRLVAIMSAAVKFRQTPLYVAVRTAVHRSGGVIDDLPPNSFKESGTGVNAVIVTYNAPV